MGDNKKKTDAEIIEDILYALRLNQRQLADILEYKSHMSIYFVTKGKNKLTQDMKNRILIKFPEINPGFLITGEGNPLKYKTITKDERFPFKEPKSTLDQFAEIPERLNALESKLDENNALLKEILEILKKN